MSSAESEHRDKERATWLLGLGAISGLNYAVLLWLSWQFTTNVPADQRPTLMMLVLFGHQFIFYGCALWLAVRLPPTRGLLAGILAFACLFRGILLPSIPIHEIDIYRYIWDGAVLVDGVSPYRYAPQQVLQAVDDPLSIVDPTMQQLVNLQATSQSLTDSLNTIHYGEYPSPYPIVSQAVFALAATITPDDSSHVARLATMKSLLVLMDLATLVVVMFLLREVGLHPGLSLAYGWCPLLMKEIANAGHLDSIAIFLTTLAIWLLVRVSKSASNRQLKIAGTGLVLALAIGAKLYPMVLLPLFTAVWLRRHGWVEAIIGLASTAVFSIALLYPLFGPVEATPPSEPAQQVAVEPSGEGQLNAPATSTQPITVEPDEGIQVFLKHWEMNDLIFMIVLENLRQQDHIAPHQRPWFVVTSDQWSLRVVTRWAKFRQIDPPEEPEQPLSPEQLKEASFALARLLTGGGFALFACWLAWRAAGKAGPHAWCRTAMLTLAWFWLTCPTQNPWYWCWVLPLLPMARYRTWYFVSALTMLYYLRFWLTAHYSEQLLFGTPYYGPYFFYFVISWIEFAPVFFMLIVEWFLARKQSGATFLKKRDRASSAKLL